MNSKFKKGDLIICVSNERNKEEWEDWKHIDGIKVGDIFEVSGVGNNKWLSLKGKKFLHYDTSFEKLGDLDYVTIWIRRPIDWKSIAKMLDSMGVKWQTGDNPSDLSYSHHSRAYTIDLKKLQLTFCGGTNYPLKKAKKHWHEYSMFSSKKGVHLFTKPSVNNTKEILKSLINKK